MYYWSCHKSLVKIAIITLWEKVTKFLSLDKITKKITDITQSGHRYKHTPSPVWCLFQQRGALAYGAAVPFRGATTLARHSRWRCPRALSELSPGGVAPTVLVLWSPFAGTESWCCFIYTLITGHCCFCFTWCWLPPLSCGLTWDAGCPELPGADEKVGVALAAACVDGSVAPKGLGVVCCGMVCHHPTPKVQWAS